MDKKEIIKGILAFVLIFGFVCLVVGSCNQPIKKVDYLITFSDGKTKIIRDCTGYTVSRFSNFYYMNHTRETYNNVKSVTIHHPK
ncbi:MAG: hypothetical protein KOO69_00610 [Victivallales bacterium]|nr:hypothetical protein [Victivallales bacterium]